MLWYAETPARRTRQFVADLVLLAWVAVWWQVATATHDLIDALGAPGRNLATTGGRLADGFADVADAVGGTPLLGDLLRSPFAELDEAAGAVADVGRAQEAAATSLADWVGLLLLVIPVLAAVLVWALTRGRAARRAAIARRLRDGDHTDLLALRALTTRPLDALLAVSPTPVADWQRGDDTELAALELRALGLRPTRGRP